MVNSERLCRLILLICLSSFFNARGTELQPWFGNQLQYEGRCSLLYQSYSRISSADRLPSHSSDDLFLTASVSNAPYPELSLELETTVAFRKFRCGGFDNFRATGRWLCLDDVAGDAISLSTGATCTIALDEGLKDISSFHHGLYETEAHIAIGKERSSISDWTSRCWCVGAIGIAERGSPWLKAQAAYEYRIGGNHSLQTFIHGLAGLGTRRLHWHDFRGYGAVQHQSIDLGIRYDYFIAFFGEMNLEYAYRAYARNFPARCNLVRLQLLYLF